MRTLQTRVVAATTLLAMAGALVMAWAPPALARKAPPTAPSAASAPSLDIELWPDHQQGLTTFIVLATLPGSVKLPATVRMPLPSATQQITWSGEISGSEASQDVQQVARPVSDASGRAIELTASTSRLVQYEAVLGPTVVAGTKRSSSLDWVQSVPAATVTFAVRVPLSAKAVVVSPAPTGGPQTDQALGQSLYQVGPLNIPTGNSQSFSVSYDTGAGQAGGIPTWLWFALAAALAVLVVAVAYQRRRRAVRAEGADDGVDEGDFDEE